MSTVIDNDVVYILVEKRADQLRKGDVMYWHGQLRYVTKVTTEFGQIRVQRMFLGSPDVDLWSPTKHAWCVLRQVKSVSQGNEE